MDTLTNIKVDDTWDDPTAILIEKSRTERSAVASAHGPTVDRRVPTVLEYVYYAVLVPHQQPTTTTLSEE